MNAIQTFWTTPGTPAEQTHGGWLDPRFHFMSWALSASLLNEHFGRTVLHTDLTGRNMLIDLLELPYDEVHLTQEGLGTLYPKDWWVMRKICSYAHAEGPFVHVDGDAFLWNGLPDHVRNKPVIAQNSQSGFQCYRIAAGQLQEAGIALPAFMGEEHGRFEAVNMGVTGGTDEVFFKEYVRETKAYYDRYLAGRTFGPGTSGFLNTLLEECFFRHYAEYRGQTVTDWIPTSFGQGYGSLANCMDDSYGLTHLIGTNKKDIYFCKQVEFQLRRRFPKVFRKVAGLVDGFSKKSRNTFNFPQADPFTESNVVASHIQPGLTVTLANCEAVGERFGEGNDAGFSKIIGFESAKHLLFLDLIRNAKRMDEHQHERLSQLAALLQQPVSERLGDLICSEESIPLMRFTYPSKTAPYYLATTYDFSFGYKHITHRPLDNLAVFILLSASEPVSVGSIADLVAAKSSKEVDEAENARLLRRVDLKIKELVFLGLLAYVPLAEMADAIAHEKAAGF
jgi:hypothetical protein